MTISMYQITVETYLPMLKRLSELLKKGVQYAEAKKFDSAVLVQARLAPDMYPLVRQIQLGCDAAKNCVPRLAGVEPVKMEDNETTMDELLARVAKTIDYLSSFKPEQINGSEDRDIKIPTRDRTLEFKGLNYVRHFSLPNFFFHITTTYAILRHNGVELSKLEYLPPVT